MERATKVLLLRTVFLVLFASNVEGGRTLKSKEKVEQPQDNFGWGTSGSYATPGGFGFGFGGPFPSPDSPGFGGSFPPGFVSSFCSLPGIICALPQKTNSGGSTSGGSGSLTK